MSSTNPILGKPKGIFRSRGFSKLSILLLGGVLYFVLFGDALLKTLLENGFSEFYGAKINIGQLKTSLKNNTVNLSRIQFTNPYSPMKNLLEIDNLEFNFLPSELLRRKLIVPQMTVTGIHTGTQREASGALYGDTTYSTPTQSIFDKVNTTVFSNVRGTLDKNPLKQLAPISAGYYLPTRMDPFRRDLHTVRDLTNLKTQMETLSQQGVQWLKKLPNANRLEELKMQFESLEETRGVSTPTSERAGANLLTEIRQHQSPLGEFLKTTQETLELVKSQANNVGSSLQYDLNFVKGRLNLPEVEVKDLSYALFGTTVLNDLEKLAYWIYTLREKMPIGIENKGIRVVQQPKPDGNSFHFGTLNSTPSLWIKRIEFSSEPDLATGKGKVSGSLQGLTLDPLILGAATSLSLDAEFPKNGIEGLHLDLLIDHAGTKPKETFSLTLNAFPIENWIVSQTSDYKLKVAKGLASLISEGSLNGDTLNIQWEFNVEEAEMAVSSRYKAVEDTLKQLVQSSTDFSLRGYAQGETGNVDFQMQSELGKKLGRGISETFKQQILTLDESLKNRILDDLVPLRQGIFEKIGEIETGQLAHLRSTLTTLQSLEQKTDKLLSMTQQPQTLTKRTRKSRLP